VLLLLSWNALTFSVDICLFHSQYNINKTSDELFLYKHEYSNKCKGCSHNMICDWLSKLHFAGQFVSDIKK
jgi:hypothetical protein